MPRRTRRSCAGRSIRSTSAHRRPMSNLDDGPVKCPQHPDRPGCWPGRGGRGSSHKAARLAGSRGRRSFVAMTTTSTHCGTPGGGTAGASGRRGRRRPTARCGGGAVRPEGLQPELGHGRLRQGAGRRRRRRTEDRRAWPARPSPPRADRPRQVSVDNPWPELGGRLRRRLARGGRRGDRRRPHPADPRGDMIRALLTALVVAVALAAPAEASVTTFATGLTNPRHVRAGPGGALYVAEAGIGGDQLATGASL